MSIRNLKMKVAAQVSIPQAVGTIAIGVISSDFTGFVLTWVVSIPQAVGTIAIVKKEITVLCLFVKVSIPQAVGTIAIYIQKNICGGRNHTFQYRKR